MDRYLRHDLEHFAHRLERYAAALEQGAHAPPPADLDHLFQALKDLERGVQHVECLLTRAEPASHGRRPPLTGHPADG